MTYSPSRSAALVFVVAILLTGCAAQAQDTAISPPPTAAAPAPAETKVPLPTATTAATPAAAPTCEKLIPETTVDSFTDVGWTAQSQEFRIGARELPGGISCTWGLANTVTDEVLVYAWAPLAATDAAAAEQDLLDMGWQRVESNDGRYITEDPSTAFAVDDEGFGITYEFGDGWVKMADTKLGLVLIEWPRP